MAAKALLDGIQSESGLEVRYCVFSGLSYNETLTANCTFALPGTVPLSHQIPYKSAWQHFLRSTGRYTVEL